MRKLCSACFVVAISCRVWGVVYYVTPSGGGNCSDWANACSLPTALSSATSGDEVWVQAGTYSASSTDLGTFEIPNGVRVIGGFAGSETSASASDPAVNVTILNGTGTARTVQVASASGATVLRGFTIQNGKDTSYDGGGGLLVADSSALFVRCIFKSNAAAYFGGAVAIRGNSSPQFVNCVFKENGTGSGTSVQPLGGGAVFVYSGSPTFTNCLFHDNKAGDGGAMVIVSGTPIFRDCTLANNQATISYAGGILDQEGVAVVYNSLIWGNTAVRGGDQVYNAPGSATTITYSDIQGGWAGTGNINADPLFLDAAAGDFDLPKTSPCKDVGNNPDLPLDVGDLDWDGNTGEKVPKDLGMDDRKVQFKVDMGAYEAPFVDQGGSGT